LTKDNFTVIVILTKQYGGIRVNKKKIVLAIVAVTAGIIYLVHRACSATKNAKESVPEDRLIGVFLTQDYLDSSQKLYATKVPETYTYEDGTTSSSFDYVFDGVEGFRCLTATAQMPKYVSDSTGEFIDETYESHISISDITCTMVTNVGQEENGAKVSKSEVNCYLYTYAGTGSEIVGIYCNPVYQDSEGNVYAISGHNISVSCDKDSVGLSVTNTLDYSNSKSKPSADSDEESITVNVQFSVISRPVSYTVTQYDASGKEIANQVFYPEDVPSEIEVLSDCDYAIAVETPENGDINRSLLDKDNSSFSYYTTIEGSFALGSACRLIWP